MHLGIEGRVALVTGASQGIGRGIASELVANGARVAVSSRSRERIEATAAAVGATPYVFDSNDLGETPALLAAIAHDLGAVEILVTNTGGPPAGPDLGFEQDQWEDAYRNLVLSPMALIQEAVPGMRDRGWGRIVGVGSVSSREPVEQLILSNAHRIATLAAFKTLARTVARDGVTVNTILTGHIATDRIASLYGGSIESAQEHAAVQIPVGRLGTVEELAAAAAFLCSGQASFITGVALLVDGGMSHGI